MASRRFIHTIRKEEVDDVIDENDLYEPTMNIEDDRPFYKKPLGIALIVGISLVGAFGLAYWINSLIKKDRESRKKDIDEIKEDIREVGDEDTTKYKELKEKLKEIEDCPKEGMVQISQDEYDSLSEMRAEVIKYLEKRGDRDYNVPPASKNGDDFLDIPGERNGINNGSESYFRSQLVWSSSLNKLKLCKVESKIINGRLEEVDRECIFLDSINPNVNNRTSSPSTVMNEFVQSELRKAMGRNRRMDSRILDELSKVAFPQ